MKIKVGDSVETLDDSISGKVVRVKDDIIYMEDEDGFQLAFSSKELIKLNTDDTINLGSLANHSISEITKEKEGSEKRKAPTVKPKDRGRPTFIVDLHIHHLTNSTRGMSNYEMLNLQLDTARGQLEFAIRQRMQKMVFIHGVGEGVLKQELYTVLGRYNTVKFYDADFKTYGSGATEVWIFQNTAS